ncbi:Protein of unknown function [Robiginitalea myxolifaciens]|uniref:Zinc-ribbon domain-containing protein n=1 Tax=Robiginitalea myxolifaciens TaxID=400055 RepID=A0A1I6FQ98_9FLAO|nr:DUF3667 domain-containing protein [Robiginitalea myxolifaciens]SFR32096.1 Protein of unknown function [Robiginitalea myxolifaciens]
MSDQEFMDQQEISDDQKIRDEQVALENKPVRKASRYQLKFRGTECLNCGHPLDLSDRFCPQCGQANSVKKLGMKDFVEEFFGSIIDYDSRLIRTMSALVLRPGRITLDYVKGRRISYTNPFRFLLSLAVIYFLLLSIGGDFGELDRLNLDDKVSTAESDFTFTLENTDNLPEEIPAEARAVMDSLGRKDSLNLIQQYAAEQRRKDSLLIANPKAYFDQVEGGMLGRLSTKAKAFYNLTHKDTIYTFEEATEKYKLEDTGENKVSFGLAKSLTRALKQPGNFLDDLIAKLPFATFFFLPVFAVFVYLVYIRKNYTYTDNLVFCFHNQALFFILLIVSFLIDSIFGIDSAWFFLLAFCIYLYKAMRNFYKQGRFKTILKYLFLNTVFVILAWVSAITLLLASVFTY